MSSSPSSSPKIFAFLLAFLMGFCSKAGFSSSSSENNPFFGFLDASGCLTFLTATTYSSYSSKSIFFLAIWGCSIFIIGFLGDESFPKLGKFNDGPGLDDTKPPKGFLEAILGVNEKSSFLTDFFSCYLWYFSLSSLYISNNLCCFWILCFYSYYYLWIFCSISLLYLLYSSSLILYSYSNLYF